MTGLGEKTFSMTKELLGHIVEMYQAEIKKAWLKTEKTLSISLSLKFNPNDANEDEVDIEAGISFVSEKVKDSISATVNEKQGDLFDEKGKDAA